MKSLTAFLPALLAPAVFSQTNDIRTLEATLDYALTHNPDAQLAEQRLAAAQAGLEQADSAFWPRLQFQSSYTRTDNPMLAFGGILNQRAYNYNSPPNFTGRPELLAAKNRESAAQSELRGAQSGYLPRVNAIGSLDHDYGWVTGGDGHSYTAGVRLQWDLWDGFSSRAKTREARAKVGSAREEQRKLRLALDLELEQARLDLQAAEERLAVTAKTVEQAEESAKITRDRFEQGLAISTQLIDAETALTGARVRRVEAGADERIAVAALRKALALPQLDVQPNPK
jgi:outer membrane protein TolC